jgi:hypothetical protein
VAMAELMQGICLDGWATLAPFGHNGASVDEVSWFRKWWSSPRDLRPTRSYRGHNRQLSSRFRAPSAWGAEARAAGHPSAWVEPKLAAGQLCPLRATASAQRSGVGRGELGSCMPCREVPGRSTGAQLSARRDVADTPVIRRPSSLGAPFQGRAARAALVRVVVNGGLRPSLQ